MLPPIKMLKSTNIFTSDVYSCPTQRHDMNRRAATGITRFTGLIAIDTLC